MSSLGKIVIIVSLMILNQVVPAWAWFDGRLLEVMNRGKSSCYRQILVVLLFEWEGEEEEEEHCEDVCDFDLVGF